MTTSSPRGSLIPDLCLLGVALIWGLNMPIMKFGITEVDPWLFNAFRLTISSIVLGICVVMERRAQARKKNRLETHGGTGSNSNKLPRASIQEMTPGTSKKERSESRGNRNKRWIAIGLFALFTGAVYQFTFLLGMDRTTAGNTAIIMSSLPMWTAFIAALVLRERFSNLAWTGLIVAFVGTLVVTFAKREVDVSSQYMIGNMILLGAALAWAIGSVVSRPLMKSVTPIQLAFIALVTTLPFHFMAAINSFGEFDRLLVPQNLLALLYSGAFSTGLAYAMWNFGVQQLGAAHAAVYQNFVPVVALITSWLFLAETPLWTEILGGAVIVFGLLVVRQSRMSKSK